MKKKATPEIDGYISRRYEFGKSPDSTQKKIYEIDFGMQRSGLYLYDKNAPVLLVVPFNKTPSHQTPDLQVCKTSCVVKNDVCDCKFDEFDIAGRLHLADFKHLFNQINRSAYTFKMRDVHTIEERKIP